MSNETSPVSDTWNAVKNRLAGPFGTFVVVWAVEHPRVISYLLFDATGNSGVPQATAKADKISSLIGSESFWVLFLRPLLWTVLLMLLLQCASLAWHYVNEWFRYFQERVTAQKDVQIHIYRRFGQAPEDVIATVQGEISGAKEILQRLASAGNGIAASNETERLSLVQAATLRLAKSAYDRLDLAVALLSQATSEPLRIAFMRWRNRKDS